MGADSRPRPQLLGGAGSRLPDLYRDFAADPSIVDRFVADYLALLDVRMGAIGSHLAAGDHEQAVVAVLSLESTSAMLGVDSVTGPAHRLRREIERCTPGVGHAPESAEATDDLLQRLGEAVAAVAERGVAG